MFSYYYFQNYQEFDIVTSITWNNIFNNKFVYLYYNVSTYKLLIIAVVSII